MLWCSIWLQLHTTELHMPRQHSNKMYCAMKAPRNDYQEMYEVDRIYSEKRQLNELGTHIAGLCSNSCIKKVINLLQMWHVNSFWSWYATTVRTLLQQQVLQDWPHLNVSCIYTDNVYTQLQHQAIKAYTDNVQKQSWCLWVLQGSPCKQSYTYFT